MVLNKKQSKHLNELLKDLNKRCSENEEVKLALRNFTCGHVEIYFELFYKNKGTAFGNYSDMIEYIEE